MKHLPPWKQRLIRPLFRPHTKSPSSDQGLTLIEGLVAILIISAVTTAITPMMFLSVATRVQNRRAEQAVQLAHGQIDQVRVLIDQGLNSEEVIERQLPPLVPDVQSVRDVGLLREQVTASFLPTPVAPTVYQIWALCRVIKKHSPLM